MVLSLLSAEMLRDAGIDPDTQLVDRVTPEGVRLYRNPFLPLVVADLTPEELAAFRADFEKLNKGVRGAARIISASDLTYHGPLFTLPVDPDAPHIVEG